MINYNGELKPANALLFKSGNRAFRYGDGLFETIRVFNGKLPFLKIHIERLRDGLKMLKFENFDHLDTAFIETEIHKLIGHIGNHRIRLSIFRSDGGLYTPTDNRPEFLIESSALDASEFSLNSKGLNIGIYKETSLAFNSLSALKTSNSLPYILAGIYNKARGFDDCLILNTAERLCESISSNLFVIKERKIFTPPISEACIAGTMRKTIIRLAREEGLDIQEIPLSLDFLKTADELWLTNAIQGIRWVKSFEDKIFENPLAQQFVKHLNFKIQE